jgi:glucose 1-dehydrogenase
MPKNVSRPLEGQVALVTGGSSGIGAGVAVALAAAGAAVGVNYASSPEGAAAVVDEIERAGGTAVALQADVSREEQVQAVFRGLLDRFGRLDILVANAGIQKDAAFADMTLDQWRTVLDINLTGQFLCAREAVRIFDRQGRDPEGSAAAGKSPLEPELDWKCPVHRELHSLSLDLECRETQGTYTALRCQHRHQHAHAALQ